MLWTLLPRVAAKRLAGQPPVWIFLGLATVLVPVMAHGSPTQELEAPELVGRLVTRWSALARLAGALVAIGLLSRLAPLRRWLPPAARLAGEATTVLLASLAATVPLYLGGRIALAATGGSWPADVLGPLGACLHLAALATLLLRAQLPARLHVASLLTLVWVLPSFLPPGLLRWLAPAIDPGRTERVFSSFGLASTASLLSFTLVSGLLLAAALAVRGPGGLPRP